MGMDVTAYLVYGIKLPEEWLVSDDDISPQEAVEEIFYSTSGKCKYNLLQEVLVGYCDGPEIIIACKNHVYSAYWTAEPLNISNLEIEKEEFKQLTEFMQDYQIEGVKAQWYLSCYVSN